MQRMPIVAGLRCLVSEKLAGQQRQRLEIQMVSLYRIRKDNVLASDFFQTI